MIELHKSAEAKNTVWELAVCGSVDVGISLELDVVQLVRSSEMKVWCNIIDNTSFYRKSFESLLTTQASTESLSDIILTDKMERAPRPSMLIKIFSQHWKSVVLCLALTAFFMVEAAPARAGAMKKGGRWAHPGTPPRLSRLMRSWQGRLKGRVAGQWKEQPP